MSLSCILNQYSRVSSNVDEKEYLEDDPNYSSYAQTNERASKYLWYTVTIILAGFAGFVLGATSFPRQQPVERNLNAVSRGMFQQSKVIFDILTRSKVPIGELLQTFQYNESFAAAPATEGGPEPIWDSLIPSQS